MARLSTPGARAPDHTSLNLTRLISRLQNTLLEPDAETSHRLRASGFERRKVEANLEYAKTLLLRLGQESPSVKPQPNKQDAQSDLQIKKRQLDALDARLHELNAAGQEYDDNASSEGEDLLGEDTPSESVGDSHTPAAGDTTDDDDADYQQILSERRAAAQATQTASQPQNARDELFPSSLRARHGDASAGVDTAKTTSSSTSAPITESLMKHHRAEQEELTTSLLSMAQALKASSQSFSQTLESEKETVNRAGEGLDRNVTGMEAASKRMGYLRQMSEGKGWWGRMMLYAWIFGLIFKRQASSTHLNPPWTNPTMSSILVLGAGELGTEVLKGLAAHPSSKDTQINVLLRPSTISSTNPSKAADVAAIKALGITLVPGDIVQSSPVELAQLFAPYHTVISCTGFIAGPGTQMKIAQAALGAGVKRYFPWQFGVDYDVLGRGSAQDLFDEQLDVRDLLRGQSSTEWVIASTGMFTNFLFEPSFGVVVFGGDDGNGTVVRCLGGWENKVTVTTAQDIGILTAEIVFVEPIIANQVVYTAGETISYGRLATVVENIVGKPVKREEWPVEWMEGELEKDPRNVLWKYRVVFGKGKGMSWDEGQTFNVQQGIRTSDVEEWARDMVNKKLGK
ncbi:hypothetical protein V496_02772 [Pseudogymnoascus sp. VKM F-4515 (FW-2607)]|nr:hypothetical protein V496_02772 [Pseudogymnoascus sp. VKM F-4515 (FW-2607)]KFY83247.1 hypothetical protein V498_08204 [Pseudogymnoascus sp. VKM F-4517 (FW-2822)]